MSDLRSRAQAVLERLVTPEATLRDDQWVAIEALVADRRRALVVQRTGWGKSAVYFVATALLREGGAGPTVIVSPLLALMRNQVEAAARAGIRSRTINSANTEDWEAVHAEMAQDEVDLLLVSPERLNSPAFRDTVLPWLAQEAGLVVIDEAHCVSDWGHDFRPDYRRIRTLLADLPPGSPVLATTATANSRVVADVAEQLGADALVLRGPLERESLRLGVVALPSPAQRLAWLADHLPSLDGSGIVYTLTVAQADEVAAFLRSTGLTVSSYSGRTENADRLAAEEALLRNEIKALVATSALGMGFDKPDLGFVIHLGAPSSPIAYYQQVGRAGRATEKADVVLLPGAEDEAIWRWYDSMAFPPPDAVADVLAVLAEADRPVSTGALEPRVELSRSRLELVLKVLDVDGAVRRVSGGWTATGRPWEYDEPRYRRVAEARSAEQQAMRDYIAGAGCRMEFLRRQLDDPAAAACGRCDNCTGVPVDPAVSEGSLAAARGELARAGVEVEPRKMWPTGLESVGIPLKGRIAAEESAEPGRALARWSDLGWGPRLRELLGPGTQDAVVPVDVFNAVLIVLRDWAWETRPDAVVAVDSLTRPRLVSHLAQRVAAAGRLEHLGVARRLPVGRPASTVNSAQRVKALHTAFDTSALVVDGRTVLLVDDVIRSGWTTALVARQLRQAGALAVLPLALALDA
ncbi:MAG: ATP-dependent helicase RecQ [Frankiaceae bacterium]|nr:ATP-dependent helicase RecQ [Frankiaceae bacterium]